MMQYHLPEQILLGTLRHPGLRLRAPLRITLSQQNEVIIAECPELNEHGYGPHFTAAITDLQRTIVELYWTLKEEQDNLGGDLPVVWTMLQAMIHERANRARPVDDEERDALTGNPGERSILSVLKGNVPREEA